MCHVQIGLVRRFAGGGSGTGIVSGFVDGTGTAALFSTPNSIAVSNSGTVYVTEKGNNLIRVITVAGNTG